MPNPYLPPRLIYDGENVWIQCDTQDGSHPRFSIDILGLLNLSADAGQIIRALHARPNGVDKFMD